MNWTQSQSHEMNWYIISHSYRYIYIYHIFIHIYIYINVYIAKHKIPQQEIHEITYNYVLGMHWHEWIDDMNELMMKYLNEMTTMKDMNTCMKWTTWPDMKWHEMTWHEMTCNECLNKSKIQWQWH